MTLDLTGKNNLVGLRDAINGLGLGVTASILTTGTGATPNYLSLSAGATGATTLTLKDLPTDPSGTATSLITNTNQGSDAKFDLNNVAVQKASNSVNDVIPGMTFTLQSTTSANQSVQLSTSSDGTQLTTDLQSFVTNYNALVDQVNAQVGQSAGLLSGDFMIHTLSDDMRQLSAYQNTGSGTVQSIADLGLTFDTTGKLSLDTSVVSGMSDSQLKDAVSFLGSSTSGFGNFTNTFSQLSDPTSGFILQEENGLDQENSKIADQVSTLNDRISVMQTALTAKLQQADALVAELDNTQTNVNASLQSLNYVLYGKQVTGAGS